MMDELLDPNEPLTAKSVAMQLVFTVLIGGAALLGGVLLVSTGIDTWSLMVIVALVGWGAMVLIPGYLIARFLWRWKWGRVVVIVTSVFAAGIVALLGWLVSLL